MCDLLNMADLKQLLYDIEVHNPKGIASYFESGGNPNEMHDGIPLFTTMIDMYLRSPRFSDCIRVFVDHGLEFEDRALLAVFLSDVNLLSTCIKNDYSLVHKKYSGYQCAFTPLNEVTLLHICAEYNLVAPAKILIAAGADVNAKAGNDKFGFGGHTPIFHTVNQHQDNSRDMRRLLLTAGAESGILVKGIIWGKDYPWETFIPDVTPISYTKMGCLPQMQRKEEDISEVIRELLQAAYNTNYVSPNIPNKYLTGG
jgi:hypothetical protein